MYIERRDHRITMHCRLQRKSIERTKTIILDYNGYHSQQRYIIVMNFSALDLSTVFI